MKFVLRTTIISLCLLFSYTTQATLTVADPLNRIVAVVNNDVITALELDAEVDDIKKQLESQNTRLPPDSVIKKQILERMILQLLQLQRAEKVHIRVDDEMVNRALSNIANQNRLSLEGLRQAIERQGDDYSRFRERVRKEIIIDRLQKSQVLNRITVTRQEIETFLKNQSLQGAENTEYDLGHILIALPEGASAEQIKQAKDKTENILEKLKNGEDFAQMAIANSDGQKALEGGKLGWRNVNTLPSLFTDWLQNREVNDISDAIRSPNGFHILKLLGKRTNEKQHIVTQSHVRHILVRTDEFTSNEEARKRLLNIRDRILKGEDFSQLAKLHSDDTGSADKGGDLGWVDPGVMVPPFEKAFTDLAVNTLSDPVKTQFGWHLIEVLGRRSHDITETVKRNKARESIISRKSEPALQNWFRGLKDGSYIDIRL